MSRKTLAALGIPAVLIPGLMTAILLGWDPAKLNRVTDYHAIGTLFPKTGVVRDVHDGDTFRLQNGTEVRLIGVDAPNRGVDGYSEATDMLQSLIDDERVYLEYDRYQDDKYGRILAWVWVGCETEPMFFPADYMHLSANRSRPGLTDNPEGCMSGALVNEEMVKSGNAETLRYKDRGPLKYEERIEKRQKN